MVAMIAALHLIASAYVAAASKSFGSKKNKAEPERSDMQKLFVTPVDAEAMSLRNPVVSPVVSSVIGATTGNPGVWVGQWLPGDWGIR